MGKKTAQKCKIVIILMFIQGSCWQIFMFQNQFWDRNALQYRYFHKGWWKILDTFIVSAQNTMLWIEPFSFTTLETLQEILNRHFRSKPVFDRRQEILTVLTSTTTIAIFISSLFHASELAMQPLQHNPLIQPKNVVTRENFHLPIQVESYRSK